MCVVQWTDVFKKKRAVIGGEGDHVTFCSQSPSSMGITSVHISVTCLFPNVKVLEWTA